MISKVVKCWLGLPRNLLCVLRGTAQINGSEPSGNSSTSHGLVTNVPQGSQLHHGICKSGGIKWMEHLLRVLRYYC